MQISFLSNWEKCDMCQSLEIRDLFCSLISEALVFDHPHSTWILLSAGQSCLPLLSSVRSAEDVDLSQEAARLNDSQRGGASISAWDTARSLGERKGVGGCYFQAVLPLTANFAASCGFYCSCSKEATGVNSTQGISQTLICGLPTLGKHRLTKGMVLVDRFNSTSLMPAVAQWDIREPLFIHPQLLECHNYTQTSTATLLEFNFSVALFAKTRS